MVDKDRNHFDVLRKKRQLYSIGISIINTESVPYKASEFSTLIYFNYTKKHLKAPLETLLLGFVELDEFMEMDSDELYDFFTIRNSKYSKYLIRPIE